MGRSCSRGWTSTVIYPSGAVRRYSSPCESWRCEPCTKQKLEELSVHMSIHAPMVVWTGRVSPYWSDAARKAARKRAGMAYFVLRLEDEGLWVASDTAFGGRGWQVREETPLKEALVTLATWQDPAPKRQDFLGKWPKWNQRDQTEKTETSWTGRFPIGISRQMEARLFRMAGLEPGVTWVPDPEEARERLEAARARLEAGGSGGKVVVPVGVSAGQRA